MPRGSSLHRVDCRRVHCSWHRPTRTAWLNFGAENIARKVQERFSAGVYKVAGCNVNANAPTGEGNRWNPLAWTVMLTDLAGTVTERDIYQAIPEFNKPRRVVMGKTACNVDNDTAAATVKSMLLEFGPLEWWEVSTIAKGKRIKAQARFFDESHAREAASSLDNKLLPFSKTARLTVRLMTSAKFKVSTRIYDALSERLGSQTPIWEGQHLHFVAYPPLRGYRVLKLESEDSRLLAQAKETVERIVAGEVVKKDGKDLWNPGLGRTGDEYKRLKQVERDYGVVIVRDRRKSQLRLFGPEGSCRQATEALETLIQDSSSWTATSDSHVIELNVEEFQWACRGGFKGLTSQLGDNKTTFDITSTPKRILIGGSKADYTAALAIIASRQIGPATAVSDTQTDCPVCLTEAEEPTRTSCGHVYCAGCFSDLCQAEGSASTEFRISCVGGEGRCEKILALSELQDLLSSAAFEAILEASFASYIRRHPTNFRYCPTPDCGQIYRPAADSSMIFTCTKCLIPTCTKCHSPHPGITCAEHKERTSGGYEALERVKKELGIKDCPKCRTAMEKIAGCNHMTCSGCGTHICWVCMAAFDTDGQCYDHLSKMHGGAFDYENVVF
ncbi:hypothetical protein C8A01DRAFT_19571 [Parachaetomium inaequale]|uniref:RING-type domain-containing protein n=1 Tax=Parachaetomium inaequale TaxID=2588326 RepID=A0AAN6SN80_9PEZI|nr:hypothetical protein C8A01DRAFT_19571 [Parachaetomium inaequale]